MENTDNPRSREEMTPSECLFFRCPQGHENTIRLEEGDKYDKMGEGEIVVHCQFCSWKSAPFKPTFFQHLAPGDVLLWVYTTRDIDTLRSSLNISFDGPPVEIGEKSGVGPFHQEVLGPTRRLTRADIADTAEMPLAKTQTIQRETLQQIPRIEGEHTQHYFPKGFPPLKIVSAPALQLVRAMLWVAALAFSFYALRSCERQAERIAAAIETVKPIATQVGQEPKPQERKAEPPRDVGDRESQRLIEQEQQKYARLQDSYQALDTSYQKELRTRKDLEKRVETTAAEREDLLEEQQKIREEWKKAVLDAEQGQQARHSQESLVQALGGEFLVDRLSSQERDFLQVSLARDGKFFIFYDDVPGNDGRLQKSLKIAIFAENGQLVFGELFRTEPLRSKKREVPLMYSWDGWKNVAVLTRVEGVNTVYHIKFQVQDGALQVEPQRLLSSATFPEVLGPPSISPDGIYVAWTHKTKSEQSIKVHSVQSGNMKYERPGGGDTSKSPAWSPDGKVLFFVTDNGKGITAWRLPAQAHVKNFPREIYGCFLSCSPDGANLAFFQNSEGGKGKVDLWSWKWEAGELKMLQQDIMTVETCRPSWSRQGRFLAMIYKGTEEQIAVQDTISGICFPAFREKGNIEWVDWTCPQAIFFTYKEGLYTRPYRARFVSCFDRY